MFKCNQYEYIMSFNICQFCYEALVNVSDLGALVLLEDPVPRGDTDHARGV